MRSRQLKFVFAASPQGGGESGPADASAGRDFLLHTANRKTASELGASAADAGRLLEAVASPANLATALLNVVRNEGAPGVDGRSVEQVLGSIRKFLRKRLRLLVNDEKSKVARPDEIHFLGFRLRKSQERTKVEVHVSSRTKERMDAKIRELTPRMWGQSSSRCIERLNVYLRGWSGYFRICTEENVYRLHVWDAHIRRRLRAILVRQKKRPRHLYRHLQHRGASVRGATHSAWCRRGVWYRSNTPGMTVAYRNAWFHERLVSLASTWEALNPRPKLASGQTLLFDL